MTLALNSQPLSSSGTILFDGKLAQNCQCWGTTNLEKMIHVECNNLGQHKCIRTHMYTYIYIYIGCGVSTPDANGKLKVWVNIPDPKHLLYIIQVVTLTRVLATPNACSVRNPLPPPKKKKHVPLVTGRGWMDPTLSFWTSRSSHLSR